MEKGGLPRVRSLLQGGKGGAGGARAGSWLATSTSCPGRASGLRLQTSHSLRQLPRPSLLVLLSFRKVLSPQQPRGVLQN